MILPDIFYSLGVALGIVAIAGLAMCAAGWLLALFIWRA